MKALRDDLVWQRANGDQLSLRFNDRGALSSAFLTVCNRKKSVDVTAQLPGINSREEAIGRLRAIGFQPPECYKSLTVLRSMSLLRAVAGKVNLCLETFLRGSDDRWHITLIREGDRVLVAPPIVGALSYQMELGVVYLEASYEEADAELFLKAWCNRDFVV